MGFSEGLEEASWEGRLGNEHLTCAVVSDRAVVGSMRGRRTWCTPEEQDFVCGSRDSHSRSCVDMCRRTFLGIQRKSHATTRVGVAPHEMTYVCRSISLMVGALQNAEGLALEYVAAEWTDQDCQRMQQEKL